jgi:tRNA dimethylallyltransferase
VLHRRIEARFTEMLAAGFLDEVAGLRERGDLHPRLPALRAVGYRQLWEHLEGRCSLDEAQQRARGGDPPAGQAAVHVAA